MTVIAAIAGAAGIILDKIILSYQKVGHRQLIIILFVFLFLLSALFYPWFGKINLEALRPEYLFLLFLVVLIASIYNVLYYHGVEKEKIAEVELITMLTPLSTIVIASIFLQAERHTHVLIAGLIASLTLIFAHIKRRHLSFDVFQKGLIIYLLLYPIEAILLKSLLSIYSPLAMYMVRTFFILIFLSTWFYFVSPYFKIETKLSFHGWKAKNYYTALIIAALAVVQMVFIYWAYADFGIVYTTIILTLMPILVYLGSVTILKERVQRRVLVAALVILGCIVYAHISQGK